MNEIKEAVNASAGSMGTSRRIAGEPGREYVLLRDEEEPGGGREAQPAPRAGDQTEFAAPDSAAPSAPAAPLQTQEPLVLTFAAADLLPASDTSAGEEVGWEDVEDAASRPELLVSPGGTTESVPDVGLREQRDLHWRERAARRQRFWSLAQGFRQGRALSDWGKAGDGYQGDRRASSGHGAARVWARLCNVDPLREVRIRPVTPGFPPVSITPPQTALR